MVERKTLLSVLLIVVLVSAAGYTLGRFSTLEERVTTTTTSTMTTTQTTTSSTTITETMTKTSARASLNEQETQLFAALESVASFQLLDQSLKLTTADGQTVLTFGVLSNTVAPSNFISSDEAVSIASQFKGWGAAEIASYGVFTEMRYLNESLEDGEKWLDIYIADPKTGEILRHQQSLSFKIPDPVVKLRGYYWYVSINTNPDAPPMEAGTYSHSFWINAVNATIMHSKSPPR